MQIPVNSPLITPEDIAAVVAALEDGWISGDGPVVSDFEEAMAASVGRKHGISVSNGTVAIDIAISALAFQKGDEIIVPSFTIISVINQILREGLVPRFVDCDPLTWNMNTDEVEGLINPRTRAIIAVHTYGLPVDMAPLLKIAEKHNLVVIEDASEAHGLQYDKKTCGSFGLISTFSFYANKHVTSGEGGMIMTDDDEIAKRLRSLKNLCFVPSRRFVHDELGWNGRMSSLQCALAHSQLKRLPTILSRRREIADQYFRQLSNEKYLQLPLAKTKHGLNDFWVFGVVLLSELSGQADAIRTELDKVGVGNRPFFWSLHEQPVLKKFGITPTEKCPITENIARSGFYLPNSLAITDEQITYVCDELKRVCNEYLR
jgi:perosamine synthetase